MKVQDIDDVCCVREVFGAEVDVLTAFDKFAGIGEAENDTEADGWMVFYVIRVSIYLENNVWSEDFNLL